VKIGLAVPGWKILRNKIVHGLLLLELYTMFVWDLRLVDILLKCHSIRITLGVTLKRLPVYKVPETGFVGTNSPMQASVDTRAFLLPT